MHLAFFLQTCISIAAVCINCHSISSTAYHRRCILIFFYFQIVFFSQFEFMLYDRQQRSANVFTIESTQPSMIYSSITMNERFNIINGDKYIVRLFITYKEKPAATVLLCCAVMCEIEKMWWMFRLNNESTHSHDLDNRSQLTICRSENMFWWGIIDNICTFNYAQF